MKPRILFILHLPPPVHGAAMVGKYIQQSTWIKQEFEADFINLSTSTRLQESGRGSLKKVSRLLRIQFKLIKALLMQKYSLCYMTLTSCGPGFYKDLFIVCILKAFRKNIIYHFHNKGVAAASKSTLNHFLYSFTFSNTRSILISNYLYQDIERYVSFKNVFICPNGIPPLEMQKQQLAPERCLSNSPCQLLFLSNMIADKGVYVLLRACQILKEKAINFNCHFVGDWSDITQGEFHRRIKEYNLHQHVFEHGKKYGSDKLDYLTKAEIFVFPTFYSYETFGLVNLEAMQCHLPIVATDAGGIPDVVVDGITGFIVPQKNAEVLAEKLELLIKNPSLRFRMGRAGAIRYEEHFTLEKFEKRLTKILSAAARKTSV